jgi:lipoprotein NlpI
MAYTDAFNSRGLAYAKLKQFEKAIQDYNQAIELDPEYTYAFNNRGLAYNCSGVILSLWLVCATHVHG